MKTFTTSLQRLRDAGACTAGYGTLAKAIRARFGLSPDEFGMGAAIPVEFVLQSNGLDDTLWVLRNATDRDDRFLRELSCDFAEHVLPIFEAERPTDARVRNCIDVARRFARGEATDEEHGAARSAAAAAAADAYSAAYAAYAAYSAAYAAYSAAAADAYSAAAAAVNAAAADYSDAAARSDERSWQSAHLAAILEGAVFPA